MSDMSLTIVIRTAGERTVEACKSLLLHQVPACSVEIVNERPFECALLKTYEIGIDRGSKWLMTLDADVLLRDGAVSKFLAEAENMPDNYFQIEGRIHDKLTGQYRQAGHRIYRTSMLRKAIGVIPHSGTEIRPEYSTLVRMEALGFPSIRVGLVVGLHDYEQYLRDIYCKSFVHANKHAWLVGDLVDRWKRLAPSDPDFGVALRGLVDGLLSSEPVRIDREMYYPKAEIALREGHYHEKGFLAGESISYSFVEGMLKLAGAPPELETTAVIREASVKEKIRLHHKEFGCLKMTPFLIGSVFCKIGAVLKNIATKNYI